MLGELLSESCYGALMGTRVASVFAAALILAFGPAASEATTRHHHRHAARGHHRRHHHARAHVLPVSADAPNAELVIDADSGLVLAVANPDQLVHPASLTKMMTLYLAFRALDEGYMHLDDGVLISAYAAAAEPTKLGLRSGQIVRADDLLRGTVTESANDAARALAEKLDGDVGRHLVALLRADLAAANAEDVATDTPATAQDAADLAARNALADSIAADGSEADFARLMTLQARLLEMDDTVFRNASGLPDPDQVTTAPDMARLAYAVVNLPQEDYAYFSLKNFTYAGAEHRNHNLRFLTGYDGADGIKTGYTEHSGFNVVDSARRGDVRLIAIVLGRRSHSDREDQVRQLLDNCFIARAGTLAAATAGDAIAVGSTLDLPSLRPAASSQRAQNADSVPAATPVMGIADAAELTDAPIFLGVH